MAATFLLLELIDPEVSAFLWEMRSIVSGSRVRGPIHVTLRGPYETEEPKPILESWRERISHDVLRISGVGRFSNGDAEVVFLKVHSPNLRTIWWKRSFPIERFGFEPHVSIYRGSDAKLANLVLQFLSENALSCYAPNTA